MKLLNQYTCRSSCVVFDIRWSVPFVEIWSNSYSCLAFGSSANKVSRTRGQAWSEVFSACESTSWKQYTFNEGMVVDIDIGLS